MCPGYQPKKKKSKPHFGCTAICTYLPLTYRHSSIIFKIKFKRNYAKTLYDSVPSHFTWKNAYILLAPTIKY